MKKHSLVLGIVFVALIVVTVYRYNHKDAPTSDIASTTEPTMPRGRLDSDVSKPHDLQVDRAATRRTTGSEREIEEIKNLRRELETAKAQLEEITRPLGQDVLSSTVNAEINPGETLVTGGYKTANGNYELTFLTPRSATLDDGREAIEVSCKVLSVGSEFVDAHGLETLATNAKNTLQHAEAWMQDDVSRTLGAASHAEGAGMLSSPKVVALPSAPFTLSWEDKGGARFSIQGTATKSPNGSFAIQSRVERTSKAEQGVVK